MRVPQVRPGRERVRAAADVRGHAGLARGLHAHRARVLRAAHDLLGGDRRARADRRRPERRPLSARVADLHPRAPARRLRAAGLDRQRRRALGPEPRPDRRRRQRLLPRLLQPAALGLRLRLRRPALPRAVRGQRLHGPHASRGRSRSSPASSATQLGRRGRRGRTARTRRSGRSACSATGLGLKAYDAVNGTRLQAPFDAWTEFAAAALHGTRPARRPRVVRVLLRPDRARSVHVPGPRDGARARLVTLPYSIPSAPTGGSGCTSSPSASSDGATRRRGSTSSSRIRGPSRSRCSWPTSSATTSPRSAPARSRRGALRASVLRRRERPLRVLLRLGRAVSARPAQRAADGPGGRRPRRLVTLVGRREPREVRRADRRRRRLPVGRPLASRATTSTAASC